MHNYRLKQEGKVPFRATDHGDKNFSSDRLAFGLDKSIPQKSPTREIKYNIMKH